MGTGTGDGGAMIGIGRAAPLRTSEDDSGAVTRRDQALTAVLALALEALIAGAVGTFVRVAEVNVDSGAYASLIVLAVVLFPFTFVGLCLVAWCIVVPLVGLVGQLARRRTGRFGGWWVPGFAVATGCATGVGCVLSGAGPATAGWTALAVAGALTGTGVPVWWTCRDEDPVPVRDARERLWLSGGLGFVAVIGVGVLLSTVGPFDV